MVVPPQRAGLQAHIGTTASATEALRNVSAYVRWFEEEDDSPEEESKAGMPARRHRAAWLMYDVPDDTGAPQRQALAYLGPRPAVTRALQEEVAALYPEIEIDWETVRRALADETGLTNVASLTDDEVLLRLPALAEERGLSLADLSFRLGYRERQVLPELLHLVSDTSRVGRFERSAGSIFDYMVEHHPEYAYLVYKARLLLEGEESLLADLVAAEPVGYDDAVWQARRRFWKRRLEAYQESRRAPE